MKDSVGFFFDEWGHVKMVFKVALTILLAAGIFAAILGVVLVFAAWPVAVLTVLLCAMLIVGLLCFGGSIAETITRKAEIWYWRTGRKAKEYECMWKEEAEDDDE